MQTITVCVLKDILVYSAQRRYVSAVYVVPSLYCTWIMYSQLMNVHGMNLCTCMYKFGIINDIIMQVSQSASIMGHVITDTVFVQKGTMGQCVNMVRCF